MIICPRCGESAGSGQEYCLGCGLRLPGGRLGGLRVDLDRQWLARAGIALVVALAGATLAVAATDRGGGGARITTATGGFAEVPTSTLTSPEVESGIVEWPPGEEGWTVVLASIPQTEGRRSALARAREARRKGIATVGLVDSSRYASLHPGYWIVFAGIYSSEAEATSALEPARRFARTATVRRIVP